jgi:hypothetical protein
MLTGMLLTESLVDLHVLDRLRITNTETWHVSNASADQPNLWTALSFEVDDAEADAVAIELSHTLKSPGWYIDARWGDEVIVIFPDRIFRYQRGDQIGKANAQTYAQAIGIPPSQIDWGD